MPNFPRSCPQASVSRTWDKTSRIRSSNLPSRIASQLKSRSVFNQLFRSVGQNWSIAWKRWDIHPCQQPKSWRSGLSVGSVITRTAQKYSDFWSPLLTRHRKKNARQLKEGQQRWEEGHQQLDKLGSKITHTMMLKQERREPQLSTSMIFKKISEILYDSHQEKSLTDLPTVEKVTLVWTDQIRKGKLFLPPNHGAIQENRTETVSNDRDHLRIMVAHKKSSSPQVNFWASSFGSQNYISVLKYACLLCSHISTSV